MSKPTPEGVYSPRLGEWEATVSLNKHDFSDRDDRVKQELGSLARLVRTPDRFSYARLKVRQNVLPMAGSWAAVVEPLLAEPSESLHLPGDSRQVLLCSCLLDMSNDFIQLSLIERISAKLRASISRQKEALSVFLWVGLIVATNVKASSDDDSIQLIKSAFDWAFKCQPEVQLWPLYSVVNSTLYVKGYDLLASEFAFACYHLAHQSGNESWLQRSRYLIASASMHNDGVSAVSLDFDYRQEVLQLQSGSLSYDMSAQIALVLDYSRLAINPALFNAKTVKYRLRIAEELESQFSINNRQHHCLVKGFLAHAQSEKSVLQSAIEESEYLISQESVFNHFHLRDLSYLQKAAGKPSVTLIDATRRKTYGKWVRLLQFIDPVFLSQQSNVGRL